MEIKVGVFDWDRFAIQGGFYPDDIPQEWRLAYYSNEFACACLSMTHHVQQIESLSLLLEDLPDGFEWSLYAQTQVHVSLIPQLLREGNVPRHLLLTDELTTDPDIAAILQQCADAGVHTQSHSSLLRQPGGLQPCALLPDHGDLRQTRQWIEQWVQECDRGTAPSSLNLWLPGTNTTYQRLVEIKTLVEMLGF